MSLRQGLRAVLGQPSAHRLVRQAVVIGEFDHRFGQQVQRPAGAALWRVGAGRRHQQGFLLARQLAFGPGARFLAQGTLQIAFHEASLGSIDGRAAHRHDPSDLLVAGAGIGGQQDLGSFELARGMLAAIQQPIQLIALGLAQLDPVTYVHHCLLVGGPGRIDR